MSAGKIDISVIVVNMVAIAKMFYLTERRVHRLVESLDYEKWLHGKAEIELTHIKKERHRSEEVENGLIIW